MQEVLQSLNESRFALGNPETTWLSDLEKRHEREILESRWLEERRAAVSSHAGRAPRSAESFVKWFEELKTSGPGQGDPLFDWLEEEANLEQMRWFLYQEVAGEAGFEDLVALSQLKLPARAKLEMARNYWDEMGRGVERGMHGPMLHRLSEELRLSELRAENEIVPASVELGHLMSGLAHHRRYAYHSIGALGVIELTAPGRAAKVYRGLKRLGVSPTGTQYYLIHSTLDVKHSEAWNAEVILPLVSERPECATWLAEGALMRLHAGAACFKAYRAHFTDLGGQLIPFGPKIASS